MFGRRDVSRSCSHDFSFASCCYYSAPRFLRFHGSSRALTPTPPTRHTHEARATRFQRSRSDWDGRGSRGRGWSPSAVRAASQRQSRPCRPAGASRERFGSGTQGGAAAPCRHLVVAHAESLCGAISTGVARHPHDWRLRGRLALPGRLLRPRGQRYGWG
jgi:hypothetical protein